MKIEYRGRNKEEDGGRVALGDTAECNELTAEHHDGTGHHGNEDGGQQGELEGGNGKVADHGADGHQRAVGEVTELQDVENHRETNGDERVHRAGRNTVDNDLYDLNESIHISGVLL